MSLTFLLETSFIIDLLQDKQQSYELINDIRQKGALGTSVICIGELYEGVIYAEENEQALLALDKFRRGLIDIVWDVNEKVAEKFGDLRGSLREKGMIIGDLDTLIAATCLVHDLTIVTFNIRHFQRVPGLKIYR